MAKNTDKAQLALGDHAARQLANATKTAPQLSTITPRWLTHLLQWIPVEAGIYRLNRVNNTDDIQVACTQRDEATLPQTFVDYDPEPREYFLNGVSTVLDVHTRVADLYSSPPVSYTHLYLGTFSKVLFPSLRLGYAVLPKELVAPFCGLRVLIDRHPPAADQHVLAAFIQEGYLERHIRRTRNVYAEVREYIIGLIEKYIPRELAWLQPGDQGMHMVLWLAQHINDIDVASSAIDAGIAIKAISPTFSKERQRSGLIVGLGDFEPELMQQAIKKLSKIIQQHDKSS